MWGEQAAVNANVTRHPPTTRASWHWSDSVSRYENTSCMTRLLAGERHQSVPEEEEERANNEHA